MQVLFGAANQNRTGDLIITNDVLYRLSHSSEPEYIIASPCGFVKFFLKEKIIIVRKSPTQSVGATVHTPRLSLPLGEGPAAPVHNLTFLPPSVREGDRVSGGRSFFRAKNSPSRHSAEDVFPMGKLRETLCVSYGRPSPRGLKDTSPLSPAFSSAFFQHAASPFALSPAGNRTTPYFPRAAAIRPANLSRRDSADATPFLSGISYNADT